MEADEAGASSMMARRGVLGLIAGGFAAVLGGCGLLGGNSYRFRMTVEVETPDGIKTGSSVYEVQAANTLKILPEERARDWSVRGEAVAVGLPGGRTLFALLKTINPKRADLAVMSMEALDPAFRNDVVESAARIASRDRVISPAVVSSAEYPLLVTFRDINDPSTVERVDPSDLDTTFGTAVRLQRFTVEITKDPVTTGIEKRLHWIISHRGTLKPDPPRTMDDASDPDLRLLDTGPFSTERFL